MSDQKRAAESSPPPRQTTTRELLAIPRVAAEIALVAGEAGVVRRIAHPRVQKAGLVLAGHRHGLVPTRVQLLGETEMTYLEGFGEADRKKRLGALFAMGPCLIVVTRGAAPFPELLAAAEATGTPLAVSQPRSTGTIALLHHALDELLAPRESVHGVLVQVHGVGLLLTGPSGIGKSETALALVERGHRLVADDNVLLTRTPTNEIVGAPPPRLRYHIELRGIGIVNVRDLFGATAVRDQAPVELVVELCPWDEADHFERLGLDDLRRPLLGVELSLVRIPVRPGRNMAVILEVAARNQLLKRAGRHAARNFVRSLHRDAGIEDPRDE
ncbi:MAG: HPr(Ser) kinase/phosphatase [Myxococcales bacterium]|nr:HPr(Ser) kinase/phosphatase [Myxococcales bacterium]MCB9630450.1 HPr(Ser) kinase/phosphatase [Sandaracinaceae bacterium]